MSDNKYDDEKFVEKKMEEMAKIQNEIKEYYEYQAEKKLQEAKKEMAISFVNEKLGVGVKAQDIHIASTNVGADKAEEEKDQKKKKGISSLFKKKDKKGDDKKDEAKEEETKVEDTGAQMDIAKKLQAIFDKEPEGKANDKLKEQWKAHGKYDLGKVLEDNDLKIEDFEVQYNVDFNGTGRYDGQVDKSGKPCGFGRSINPQGTIMKEGQFKGMDNLFGHARRVWDSGKINSGKYEHNIL